MLLDIGTATKTNCNLIGNTFSIKASPIAFDILSARLYANPIMAIIRELLTNAYDSHIAANNIDTPIDIEMPTHFTPHIKIRDYGIGLSKDDVLQLYTTFFDSTKSSSNDFTGCFGLGSKTPFAYTSSFSVNSYYQGTKYQFVVTKKDGYPSIFCTNEKSTTEANGLEITIPVQSEDYSTFKDTLNKYLRYIPELKLNISGMQVTTPKLITTYENLYIYNPLSKSVYYENPDADLLIKQGQNVYSVKNYNVFANNTNKYNFLNQLVNRIALIIEVPIGTFSVTPSREDLSKDDINTQKLATVLAKAENTVKTLVAEWNNSDTSNETIIFKSLCANAISSKYLSEFNNILKGYMSVAVSEQHGKIVATIKNEDCLINRLYYNTFNSVKHGVFPQGKSLLILVPNNFKYHAMIKLCCTLSNYSELNKYDAILTCAMPRKNVHETKVIDAEGNVKSAIVEQNTGYYSNKPIINIMRDIYNAVYLLNNIPKYNFDIEVTSITKLYKTYTNHSREHFQKTPVVIDTSKAFRYKRVIVTTDTLNYLGSVYQEYDTVKYGEWGREDRVSSFCQYYRPQETIIIPKDEREQFKLVTKTFGSIENVNGENIYHEYLNRLAIDADVNEAFNINQFYVIYVAKTNLKYFKSFPIYNHSKFMDYLKSQDFLCRFTQVDSELGHILLKFPYIFMQNALGNKLWTKQEYDIIAKSDTYKYLCKLHTFMQTKTFRPQRTLNQLQDAFDELGYSNNLVITKLDRWKNNPLLKALVDLSNSRIHKYSFVSKKSGLFHDSRSEFTRNQKRQLLQLLTYGKVKYAVFQDE